MEEKHSMDPMEAEQKISRWRLILGQDSQNRFGQMGGCSLTAQQDLMDQALAAIYNRTESGGFGVKGPGRAGAGQGPSNPQPLAGGCAKPVRSGACDCDSVGCGEQVRAQAAPF